LSLLLEKKSEQVTEDDLLFAGVPVCGGNLETPVIDMAGYIEEVHYSIAGRVYVENAD
jgi:hypothetical protein